MKKQFPPKDQQYTYLQTNRSDDLGSLWSSFNLDFQQNIGTMRLANKLVTNTTSDDSASLGLPVAFEFFYGRWWSICNTTIFVSSGDLLTQTFSVDTSAYTVGDSTSRFDITEPVANTMRVTHDGTGTDPDIDASSFPVGGTVYVFADNFSSDNQGSFTITASGNNYFEVSNPSVVPETDKTIGSGSISVYGGSLGTNYNVGDCDLCVFNERIWATNDDYLLSKDRNYSALGGMGDWVKRDTLGSGIHKMAYFKKTNRLYFVDGYDTISSIDSSDSLANSSGDSFLDLENTFLRISTIESGSQSIWIGTRIVDGATSAGSLAAGTKCFIYQWDGISPQPTQEYEVDSAGILAMCMLNDIPYAIDTDGRILEYTGYSFKEIQRLPLQGILLNNSTSSSNFDLAIHFNGMIPTKNSTILIAVNNNNSEDRINENLPSGIWEFDLTTSNFTHKHSPVLKTVSSSTVVDFGQNRISSIGAIKLNTLADSSSAGRSTLLAGFNYFTDATTVKSAIFIESPYGDLTPAEGQKRGYYVTTWFTSDEIQDKFARLWDVHKRFITSTDKIVYKYRLIEEDPTEATITWTSTTTFTTTTNVASYGPTATGFNGTTGGEVEVIQGTGSGSCTHITSISLNGGTYTVTLDTAVTGVTGTAKARFQKWIKLFPEITGQVKSWEQLAIGASNTQIQIKCCMEFTGDNEFHKFILIGNEDIKATL